MADKPDPSTLKTEADKDGKGTDPNKKPDNPSGQTFDPSKLSDEELSLVYEDKRLWEHSRFKQLTTKAKKADELEKTLAKQKEVELEKNKEWEKLATERQTKIDQMTTQAETHSIESAIEREAVKLGAVDSEAVLKLVDRQSIAYSEDGVSGVSEAVKTLLEAKPFLAGKDPQKTVGTPSNPGAGNVQPKTFTHSQIKDPAFFRENEAEINKALSLGLIKED